MYDCNFMECQVNVPICCLMANVMLLTSGNATSIPIQMTSIHLCVRVVQMKSILFWCGIIQQKHLLAHCCVAAGEFPGIFVSHAMFNFNETWSLFGIQFRLLITTRQLAFLCPCYLYNSYNICGVFLSFEWDNTCFQAYK